MKKFSIYPIDETHEITVMGNHSAYIDALNKGIYKFFTFEIVSMSQHTRKYLLNNADDKSSNMGCWYTHCNGFNMDIVWHHTGVVTVNTYREYRTNKNKHEKQEDLH